MRGVWEGEGECGAVGWRAERGGRVHLTTPTHNTKSQRPKMSTTSRLEELEEKFARMTERLATMKEDALNDFKRVAECESENSKLKAEVGELKREVERERWRVEDLERRVAMAEGDATTALSLASRASIFAEEARETAEWMKEKEEWGETAESKNKHGPYQLPTTKKMKTDE